MAQTRTRSSAQARRGTTGRSNGSSRSASSSRGSSSTRRRQARNGSSAAKSRRSDSTRSGRSRTSAGSRRQSRSSGATAPADSIKQIASKGKDTVAEGAQSGVKAISTAADKLKGPAIAGGAALAGLAGGFALGAKRNSGRKPLGMDLGNGVGKAGKNLAEASKSVGRFTENLGEFAGEMRKMREAIDDRSKHRSPIEVVLQALTARR